MGGGIYKGASPYGLETGYTGKPYDAVTGLSDYGFRDYSPVHARFITEDPIRDGENWFAYVGNNPVNWIDPWGLSASEKQGNNGNANLLLSGLTKTLSGSVKTVAGLAGAAAGMFASAVLVTDNGTVVLTVDDAALLVTVPFTAASGKHAFDGAREAVDGLTDLAAGIVGTAKTLGTWIGGTAKSAWDNLSNLKAKERREQERSRAKEKKYGTSNWRGPDAVEDGDQNNKSQSQREKAPRTLPPGTSELDQAGLPKGIHQKLKQNIHNGPKDWTGITSDGEVIINDGEGNALNLGPYENYIN